MMVGTCYTLFRMRKNLIAGLAQGDSRNCAAAAGDQKTVGRTERYMSSKTVFGADRRDLPADVRALHVHDRDDRRARSPRRW